MDARLRKLEREARRGDLDAALAWMRAASQSGDLQQSYDALMLVAELQHPDLMETIREIDKVRETQEQVRRLMDNVSRPAAGPTPYIVTSGHTEAPAMS